MRVIVALAVSLIAVVVLAAPTPAQGIGESQLMTEPSVLKELKADDAQATKLKAIAKARFEKEMMVLGEVRGLELKERGPKLETAWRGMHAETQKALAEALRPEQAKRFEQIYWQQEGVRAFDEPEIQTRLQLTRSQKLKFSILNFETSLESSEIIDNTPPKARPVMEKLQALRKEKLAKAVSLLNAEQGVVARGV